MASGVCPAASASSRSASRPLRSPSMIRCSRRRSTVQSVRSSATTSPAVTPFEHGEQGREGVVALPPPVVDEIEADLPGLLVDLRQRQDTAACTMAASRPASTHSWRNIELRTWRAAGVEAEGDVGQSDHGEDPGELGLDPPDALDRLDAVASTLLHAGRQGQDQRVEDQVGRLEPVAVDGDVVDGPGRPELPFGRAGLALGVDTGTDDGGPVLPGQGEEAVEAGAGSSPSSRLTELRMARPPIHCRAASTTGASVESTIRGTLAWVAKRLTTSFMSETPSAPV